MVQFYHIFYTTVVNSVLFLWEWLFRSENCNAVAVFGPNMAARPKEKLCLTSFQSKGQKATRKRENETFFMNRALENI